MNQDQATYPHAPGNVAGAITMGSVSLWYLLRAIYHALPPWEILPPLLGSLAALIIAANNAKLVWFPPKTVQPAKPSDG